MNLFNMRPYYNVPNCPLCDSRVTGRYIRKTNNATIKIIEDGFKNGEIIKISPYYKRDACFCLECGHEWQEYIPLTFVPKEQIATEIEDRCIKELWESLHTQDNIPEEKSKKFFGIF